MDRPGAYSDGGAFSDAVAVVGVVSRCGVGNGDGAPARPIE